MGLRIGIDLGGTKIEAVALDEAASELVRRRITAASEADAEAALAR